MTVNAVRNTDLTNVVVRERWKMASYTETLSGTKVITIQYPPIIMLDPGGSGRDVTLPEEAISVDLMFLIVNLADNAEALTVKDDGGSTIAVLSEGERAWFFCDGTTWRAQGAMGALALGVVEANRPITVDENKRLVWATTSNVTVDPFTFTSTMTGASTTGGRANFRLNIEASLGGWSNALKAHAVYGSAGLTTGRGSALVAELQLSAFTTTGSYSPLESELVVSSGGNIGSRCSFLFCNVSDDAAKFNTSGYFFELGEGVVNTTDGLFEAQAKSSINKTHTLRIKVGATDYFIPLHTSKAFGV